MYRWQYVYTVVDELDSIFNAEFCSIADQRFHGVHEHWGDPPKQSTCANFPELIDLSTIIIHSISSHDMTHTKVICSPGVLVRLVQDISCAACRCQSSRVVRLNPPFTLFRRFSGTSTGASMTPRPPLRWPHARRKQSSFQGFSRSPACTWSQTGLCHVPCEHRLGEIWNF